jgi:serine/threonine protein kinase/tetratricopeptide (TPR) repeat protein
MHGKTCTLRQADLDAYVVAFEAAREQDPDAALAQFLPPPTHSLYAGVVRELVRIDLEQGWGRGRPTSLDAYRQQFPNVFCDPDALEEIAFEEYRQRREAGQNPRPEEYRWRYGVDAVGWPAPAAPNALDGHGPSRRTPDDSAHTLPAVGTTFLGFRLVQELGRGAFGRVFLAQQCELADRPVALKITGERWGEPQTLARLQHTNIVPVYSFHRVGPLQALCMPFLGTITLADVLHDLRQRHGLPTSGKDLVSTLQARKSVTRPDPAAPPDAGSGPGAAPVAPAAEGSRPRAAESLTTLEKLQGLTYVEAVVWLAARLADGLGHAHERGILHRDLKPANVLVTDDGTPMLLDFNLSADAALPDTPAGAKLGGTLPYMAPEHLEAFAGKACTVDARSDIYSLGQILYELLTGRRSGPPRGGSPATSVTLLLDERRRGAPELRRHNAAVTPAVEAIVRRCLDPDPARRYQNARDLQEDLERQLSYLPLKHAPDVSPRERLGKFRRRHPVLASSGSLGLAAAGIVAGLLWALLSVRDRFERLDALAVQAQAAHDLGQAKFLVDRLEPDRHQVAAGVDACRRVLTLYGVVDLEAADAGRLVETPSWETAAAVRNLPSDAERSRVREDVGEALLVYARAVRLQAEQDPGGGSRQERAEFGLRLAEVAEQHLAGPEGSRPARLQQADLARLLGLEEEAGHRERAAAQLALRTGRDHFLVGLRHAARREFDKARPLFEEAVRLDPHNYSAWFYLGNCHAEQQQSSEAVYCYTACVALAPAAAEAYYPYLNRALLFVRCGRFREACADLDQALRLRPGAGEALVKRAQVYRELARGALRTGQTAAAANHWAAAERDATQALERGVAAPDLYFVRAEAREQRGDRAEAERDRAAGLAAEPGDVGGWVDRGYARLAADPRGALADFEKALALDPRSCHALQNKAHVLAERLERTAEAVEVLNRAVALHPGFVPARLGRGVLRARLGKRAEAHADAREALARSELPRTFYMAANVYALTSRQVTEDRWQALPLLSIALRAGFGLDIVEEDADMAPLRDEPEFQRLLHAAQALRAAAQRKSP